MLHQEKDILKQYTKSLNSLAVTKPAEESFSLDSLYPDLDSLWFEETDWTAVMRPMPDVK